MVEYLRIIVHLEQGSATLGLHVTLLVVTYYVGPASKFKIYNLFVCKSRTKIVYRLETAD